MAGQATKKRVEENKKRLRLLAILLCIGTAAQCTSLALSLRKGVPFGGKVAGLLFTSVVGLASYLVINAIARPVYDESGEMIDGGGDLNRGGINGYAHDFLYITFFIQVTTLLSSWFWYLYLVVPVYAFYKLWILVILPWIRTEDDGGADADPNSRKKMQRAEERAQRRRMKSYK